MSTKAWIGIAVVIIVLVAGYFLLAHPRTGGSPSTQTESTTTTQGAAQNAETSQSAPAPSGESVDQIVSGISADGSAGASEAQSENGTESATDLNTSISNDANNVQ